MYKPSSANGNTGKDADEVPFIEGLARMMPRITRDYEIFGANDELVELHSKCNTEIPPRAQRTSESWLPLKSYRGPVPLCEVPAQSPLSTGPTSKARHCCNKHRASAASDQDHVLAARFSGPVSRLGLSVVADPFGEEPSKGVLLHGERSREGQRRERGGAGERKGTREGGRSSPQERLNSAPWCPSPSSWKVAVVRITDSPDAEAGTQRGAFHDARVHPSLASPCAWSVHSEVSSRF